jgi:hypothetical protein
MGFAALVLVAVGFATGTMFRVRVLLPILLFLLVVSIAFSVFRGFSIMETALVVFLAQTIAQVSYLLGLIAHAVLVAVDREPRIGRRPPRLRIGADCGEGLGVYKSAPRKPPSNPRRDHDRRKPH